MYEYRCKVIRVIDGDTLALAVDLGCDVTVNMTVRLYGINCPEMHGESKAAGEAARAFTRLWVMGMADADEWLILRTYKDKREKYGRYLGTILPLDANQRSLNGSLLDAEHAEVAEYR